VYEKGMSSSRGTFGWAWREIAFIGMERRMRFAARGRGGGMANLDEREWLELR
jgi:hypothetical protein